ncbi:hypothetical protein JCGZ_01348 [Jatropha curcas]|uniref:SHSP domain-containing protein n=1 Tax=Jatropha curcas TaxID=180498 RepID=A0A067LC96_JATCU|nr:18.1 kDa class I heat shock protein [Jatropha curcas]KDP44848.1 hypothetical protein JCGZ_01348 [Jatropha curcas]
MSINSSPSGHRSDIFDPFWDPLEGFPFHPLINGPDFPAETSSFAGARVDWKETPTAHVFMADVPGLRKEELKVEVEDGRVLQITGERSREEESSGDTWHIVERSSGMFSRRFRLPKNAKVEDLKASMENEVLTVTVPKEEEKKGSIRSFQISG